MSFLERKRLKMDILDWWLGAAQPGADIVGCVVKKERLPSACKDDALLLPLWAERRSHRRINNKRGAFLTLHSLRLQVGRVC